MGKKSLIIIPAYNEEKNIGAVISQVKQFQPGMGLVVINDGSLDETSSVANRYGAKVLDLPFNLGIGGAMQTGYKYALENNYDMAIQIDGDGQHSPQEADKLIDLLLQQDVDMVIGSRFLKKTGYKISPMRWLGKNLFSTILALFMKKRITDPTSGFRVVNARLIKYFANHYPQDYPEVESVLFAQRNGFKVCEISANIAAREYGSSSITTFRSIYYMIKVILALIITMLKRRGDNGH